MNEVVPVTKMHGARNDFIIFDGRKGALKNVDAYAPWLCDRHVGIGADGVLVLSASRRADVKMRVINADGSEAETCGNGIRCVARYLDEIDGAGEHAVETPAGTVQTRVVERGDVFRIRVDMGSPSLDTRPLPFPDSVAVSTGNPHVIFFRAAIDGVDMAALGQSLQAHPRFPMGVNVHVAQVESRSRVRVRHYERGAGVTMACGTGAVAVALAAISKDLADSPVTLAVPGGELVVEFDGTRAMMTGPAVRVFDAEVRLGARL